VSNLSAIELKAHLPAKDFETSKQFYQDLGFTLCWSEGNPAFLHYGDHGCRLGQHRAACRRAVGC
jgi:catechol 2,3-dioxygenase-like lactoylglutathione lyase family enzyme